MNIEELRRKIASAKPSHRERAVVAPFILWFARRYFDVMMDEELMEQWVMFEIERGEEK